MEKQQVQEFKTVLIRKGSSLNVEAKDLMFLANFLVWKSQQSNQHALDLVYYNNFKRT